MACRCLLYSVCFVCNAFHRDLVVRFVAMGQQTNFWAEGLLSTRSMRANSRVEFMCTYINRQRKRATIYILL